MGMMLDGHVNEDENLGVNFPPKTVYRSITSLLQA
jgi:hypothetical protein